MTTATKAGGAVLPVVAWQHSENGGSFVSDYAKTMNSAQEWPMYYSIALTPHAPAQATIDELRAEVERLTRERDEAREHLARCEGLLAVSLKSDENSARRALKAKQIDVDAVMRLAEKYAMSGSPIYMPSDAAREALRAEITKDRK